MSYHRTHLHARHMSDRLLLASYDNERRQFHVRQARHYLLCVLAQDVAAMPEVRATLVDLIENAMDSVHDMDVTFKDYANAVVDVLLENVVPMPEARPEGFQK